MVILKHGSGVVILKRDNTTQLLCVNKYIS